MLDKAGYLQLHQRSAKPVSILCYVYDKPIADITAVCLIGMSDIARHRIDLNRHIDLTLEGIVSPLQFRKTIPRDALPISTSSVLLTDRISLKHSTVADFDSRVTREVYNAYRLAYESTQDQPNTIENNCGLNCFHMLAFLILRASRMAPEAARWHPTPHVDSQDGPRGKRLQFQLA